MKPKTIEDILVDFEQDGETTTEEAKAKLLDLFMGCVPINATFYNPHGDGWNDCRDQMIKNLEKLK